VFQHPITPKRQRPGVSRNLYVITPQPCVDQRTQEFHSSLRNINHVPYLHPTLPLIAGNLQKLARQLEDATAIVVPAQRDFGSLATSFRSLALTASLAVTGIVGLGYTLYSVARRLRDTAQNIVELKTRRLFRGCHLSSV
jgi:hypothetical protein